MKILMISVEYSSTRVSHRSSISWKSFTHSRLHFQTQDVDMFVCLRFSRHAIHIFLRVSPSPTICWSVPSFFYMSRRCAFRIRGLLFVQKLFRLCLLASLPRRKHHWEMMVHCAAESALRAPALTTRPFTCTLDRSCLTFVSSQYICQPF